MSMKSSARGCLPVPAWPGHICGLGLCSPTGWVLTGASAGQSQRSNPADRHLGSLQLRAPLARATAQLQTGICFCWRRQKNMQRATHSGSDSLKLCLCVRVCVRLCVYIYSMCVCVYIQCVCMCWEGRVSSLAGQCMCPPVRKISSEIVAKNDMPGGNTIRSCTFTECGSSVIYLPVVPVELHTFF